MYLIYSNFRKLTQKTRKRRQAIQRLRGSPCLVPFVTAKETKGEKTLEEIPVVYLSLPSFLPSFVSEEQSPSSVRVSE